MKKIENIDSFVGVLNVIKKLSLNNKFEQIACEDLTLDLLFTSCYTWVNSELFYSDRKAIRELYELLLVAGGGFINNLEK